METSNSKTSLRTVINEVTKEKLAWLDNHRRTLKTHFSSILETYEKPENKGSLKFLTEIHNTVTSCSVNIKQDDPDLEKNSHDLSVFLKSMSIDDPNAIVYFGSTNLVQHWIDLLIRQIKLQIERCEYSCLYANVMTQYMDTNSEDTDIEMEDMVMVEQGSSSQTDKEKTIQEFSERIFSPVQFDGKKYSKFLNTELFANDETQQQQQLLNNVRKEIKNFCSSLASTHVQSDHVKYCIDGLLAEDLLGSEKAITLKELRQNDDAIDEVCTLLTNRVQNFCQWKWPSPIQVDFRRNMAGRYRAYANEDIITAIYLHYLGAQWAITMKRQFKKIYCSKIWKRGTNTVGDLYYDKNSIEGLRRDFHETSFLSVLPNKMEDLESTGDIYDENTKGKRKNKMSNKEDVVTPMQFKQRLLHLISNEVHLNSILRPECPLTVVQTDMEWFGPSLMHETIISVMKFFGVTEDWLNFFKIFLECPIKVGSSEADIQIRQRGAPISHTFTSLFGETILFMMDLYVNQESGLSIYRIHDDFWFWSHNKSVVCQAWAAIQKYTELSGLKINQEKSASVTCNPSCDPGVVTYGSLPLPQLGVKWGFVTLHSNGVFCIDKEILKPHVDEMKKCLQNSNTVMSWIHCHNRYVRFFVRNFAEPAQTFGQQHIKQILTTLQAIFKEVHQQSNGDIVAALKIKFSEMWEDKNIMDSWVYWPVREGGLGLYNPFLDLIPLNAAYIKMEESYTASYGNLSPASASHNKEVNADKQEWVRLLEESKKRGKRRNKGASDVLPSGDAETITDMEASDDDEGFTGNKKSNYRNRIDFEVWCERYRETRWRRWRNWYSQLLANVDAESPKNGTPETWSEFMYGSQLKDKFGYVNFVNTNLIPLSLISAMQASKVHKN